MSPHHLLDLTGTWTYRLDPDDVGEAGGWATAPLADPGTLTLPGSLGTQGIGDPVTVETPWTGGIVDQSFFTDERYAPYRHGEDVSIPFWLQPQVYYRGAAWYQRRIEIPEGWDGSGLDLVLERVHWESTVWVDGERRGSQNSLTTAHRHDLGRLAPGMHLLTIRVDNRTIIDVGPNSHAISDHTQGNWNGIIGEIALHERPEIRLGQVRVLPDVAARRARVRLDIVSGTAVAREGRLRLTARRADSLPDAAGAPVIGPIEAAFEVDHGEDLGSRGLLGGGTHLDIDLDLGADAALWDEFTPALYALEVQLSARTGDREHTDTARVLFGLREVRTEGTRILLNDRPIFVRGSLECCVFPLTGYPPTELEPWRRIMRIARAHGLNLLRMHSWCPPEAAFVAADEAGMYLQVEGPIWANQGAAVGEGRPVDAYLHEETRRILRAYGNHPSFLMMAHGNEPGGRDAEFLAAWVRLWQTQDPRRLYTTGAGWPGVPENDFDNIPQPRAHRWGEGLASRMNAQPPHTLATYDEDVASRDRPIVSHEIGQWCVHPDLEEVAQYTGLMRPRNFGVFADLLRESGMLDQATDFLHASGRLQTLAYKEDIEAALRTEGFGGFHLLGLTDFPGQGTALVGVLNPFWEEKGYVSPEEFSRFCAPTVPLALLPRRIWAAETEQGFSVRIAHYGRAALEQGEVRWSLRGDDDAVLAQGAFDGASRVPLGNSTVLGPATIPAGLVGEATHLRLVVTVLEAGERIGENDWDVWIHPDAPADETPGVRTATDPAEAAQAAARGESVLLEIPAEAIGNDISLGFTPVFWNTAWTRGQAPHTLGLLHDPAHPLFAQFPTAGATDWQWWAPLRGARPMLLDRLPQELRPQVQVIDTWFEARRLGVLFEARLGEGRILVTSLNLDGGDGAEERLAARQLRRSILAYMASSRFAPQVEVSAEQLASVLR